MAKFFDYNAARGTYYMTEDDADGNITIATMQDVEPVLEECKRRRNSGLIDKGIKRGWWHYATIPAHVELEMRQKGVNIHNPHQTKEALRMINRDYPYLKNTRLRHE